MRLLRPLAVVLLGATLAACSSAPTAVVSPRSSAPPAVPTDRVVFRITECCGFIGPPENYFEQQARWTVYGDGTVLAAAPVSAGAAWRVTRTQVGRAQVQRWIDAAERSGIFVGRPDLGMPTVADVGRTLISFRADAAPPREVDVYALGLDRGLTGAQLAARRALTALVHDIGTAAQRAPEPYPVDRVSVLRVQWGDDSGRAPAWTGPLPAVGRCVMLAGQAATRAYLAALHDPGARWRVGAHTLTLVVRAVVPGAPACAA
ncbi:MAG: hypothetical protein ACTHMS_09915 [Jatrophihabitans sp.]|uniref:hypothetical protein n=1 Tax=Jatrophihabitans sp. TaxID=1932789 RepID=UPI003F7FAFC5